MSQSIRKVTMGLSEFDIRNVEEIQRFTHARTKASAVSYSLALSAQLAEMIEKGSEILIKDAHGETHKLVLSNVS
ncbi:hypothetical protein [Zooshikella harenae]|uniref:Uncharacterized protein n=1 Tax=Zooshikella harenae TaxID=2827238 RepID=A0ABS5ZA17_9GAMM|nr:hypothetical protein [Zooshikella harenae]MBU2710834.1 hypothetical protein [Zooshikella harenae]